MRVALIVVAMLAGCGFSISVGDNRPVDARADDAMVEIDAPIDGPPGLVCPPFYYPIGTGMYVVLDPTNFRSHHAACTSHGTHLAVIDDQQEIDNLVAFGRTVMGVNTNSRFYIGLVQAPDQTTPQAGWVDFQDRDDNPALWSQSGNNEPNDGADDNESNHQEQVAAVQLDKEGLVDLDSSQNVRAYCECDGKPVGPKALTYVSSPGL